MKSKKLKKLLALALATTMLFGNGMMSQAFAKEVSIDDETIVHATGVSSGKCGKNLTWTLEDGTLTISGSGDMYNYNEYDGTPWQGYDFNNAIIKEGVTSIGEYAFLSCSSLSNIEIPESVISIGDDAFSSCSSLSSINVSDDNKCFSSKNGVLYNKEKTSLIKYPAGKLSTTFRIPAGVTSIEGAAFSGCSSLSSIIIPEGVTSIGRSAFWGCSSLSSISIPQRVTSIEDSVFSGCSSLSSISIPAGVTSIGWYAFSGCSNLSSINIPAGVTSIGGAAFGRCSKLSSISIPKGVTSIEHAAFWGCSSLSSISIPEGVTSIEDAAFYLCSSLSSIDIPKGVTSIGGYAFSNCSSLSSINIPEGVTSIGWYAFFDCSSLSSISIPEGVTEIGQSVFSGCSSISSISIPKSVTSISNDAFWSCSNLTIYCYTDSAAHTYAIDNEISYVLFEDFMIDNSKATITLSESKYTYDGTAKQPTVVVTLDNKKLVKDTDYTVEYTNNIKVGTATVTITGKGNYTGSLTKNFTITAQNMSKATVTLSESKYTYDGTAKQPTVVVTLDNKTLVQGTDYTVEYKNNTKVGTATVTVTGKGNYTGTVQATFRIIKKTSDSNNSSISINKAKVTLSKATYYFDGKEKTPGVTVKLSGKTLKKNTDYTVSYSKNKNIGTATVTIKGKGSYTGTVKKTFKITVKKGASYTVGAYKYKISSSSAVAFAGIKSTKTTKVVIPKTVKIGGKNFKVTSIASKALSKKTKVTSVTIGENVTAIRKEAFRNCSKLSTITIKSTKLNSVGTNVFKGIKATAKIKVPSKKLSAYKKLLKGKGQGSKVKVTK